MLQVLELNANLMYSYSAPWLYLAATVQFSNLPYLRISHFKLSLDPLHFSHRSLNVHVSGAIAMYEYTRQHMLKG